MSERSAEKLQMSGIVKSFPGVRALEDVTLTAHAGAIIGLIGVNGAGKSTLMNILGGILQPEAGEIRIDGRSITIGSPQEAARLGIAFIHQELLFFHTQTVAENIFISHPIPSRLVPFCVSKQRANQRAREVLSALGSSIPPTARLQSLSVGEKQIVEIARALATGSEIVIFDEPTSSLSLKEKANLFRMIRRLEAEGKTIIYISHFLDEIMELCDRYLVLRNGRVAGEGHIAETSRSELIRMVVGKELAAVEPPPRTEHEDPVLKVEGVRIGSLLSDVSFQLNKGEVLGLWGLMGSGRTELVRALLGLDPMDAGTLLVAENGHLRPISSDRLLRMCGYVTESRWSDGLFLDEPVWKNISAASLRAYATGTFRFLDTAREAQTACDFIASMNIKTPGHNTRVADLSGGNQQKVIFSKWLAKRPRILILDEPTRGVDVGAKQEIGKLVTELAHEGTATLFISSEVEEIVALCDRVLVLRGGTIADELQGEAIDATILVARALGEERIHV